MNYILASQSPRRRELLGKLGIAFTVEPAAGEEVPCGKSPQEIVQGLAVSKAQEIAGNYANAENTVVIGADTVVAAEGKILGKPAGHKAAEEMIALLAGGTHQVYTGVTLVYCGQTAKRVRSFVEKTDVHVYPMTQKEIMEYSMVASL